MLSAVLFLWFFALFFFCSVDDDVVVRYFKADKACVVCLSVYYALHIQLANILQKHFASVAAEYWFIVFPFMCLYIVFAFKVILTS